MSPIVPILAVLGAAAGAATGVWYLLRRGEEMKPEPDPDPDPTPGPTPTPPKDPTYCKKAGKSYDVDRWSSPLMISAAFMGFGYPVGPTLKTANDKIQIKDFQRRMRELGIGPYANAPDSWITGRVGPCLLISMSDAEGRLIGKAGEGEV